jgi:hypothetical protein
MKEEEEEEEEELQSGPRSMSAVLLALKLEGMTFDEQGLAIMLIFYVHCSHT